jgi:chromate transport protein ChrA
MTRTLTLSEKLLPGVFALLFLFIYYSITSSPDVFVNWFTQTVIVYAAWFFLLRAIISMTVDHVFDRRYILPMCVGALALIVSMVIFKTTPEMIFVDLLEATVLYSMLTTIYGWMRDRINGHLKI